MPKTQTRTDDVRGGTHSIGYQGADESHTERDKERARGNADLGAAGRANQQPKAPKPEPTPFPPGYELTPAEKQDIGTVSRFKKQRDAEAQAKALEGAK